MKKGDTIGFAAPSFGCAVEPYRSGFDNALLKLRSRGYRTRTGPNCYAGDGIGISSTPSSCGAELTAMYCGDYGPCRALLACGGGELMCETMDHVDQERIRDADPVWYMGYSDNTNFVLFLTTFCDTAAIYGPNAPAFGMRKWHRSLRDAFDLMTGKKLSVSTYGRWEKESLKSEDNPLEPYNCTEKTRLKISSPVNAEDGVRMHGRLLGGCLDILELLCGTGFDHVREFEKKYADDGVVWFLEACDFNVFSIRRAMWKLEHAGWFETAKGFLIGRPYHFDEPQMGLDQYDAVLEYAARRGVPVVMDCDIGHLPPMMPLISGSLADVYAKGDRVTVDMKLV